MYPGGAAKEFHEVHIGEECYLGAGSFLDSGCHMEDCCFLPVSDERGMQKEFEKIELILILRVCSD